MRLLERIRFEAALRELLADDDGHDIILKIARVRGSATVKVVDWPDGVRRQRSGKAACLSAALRTAVGDNAA